MTIDYQIEDVRLQYDTTEKLQKSQPYHQENLARSNILLVKIHCLLIKSK